MNLSTDRCRSVIALAALSSLLVYSGCKDAPSSTPSSPTSPTSPTVEETPKTPTTAAAPSAKEVLPSPPTPGVEDEAAAPTPRVAAKPPPKPLPIQATVQRLRAERPQRLVVSRGARFVSLVAPGGLVQTLDGSRGRVVAEHRLAPNVLCGGRAITRDGRRALVRGPEGIQLLGLFDGRVHYQNPEPLRRARCTLDGDEFHVVELSAAGGRVTHTRTAAQRGLPSPEVKRIRRVLTDRTARVVVADGERDSDEVWMAYGGGGGKFWRAFPRPRGGKSWALSASGRWFVASYGETQVRMWDLDSDKPVATWPFRRVFHFQGGDDRLVVETNQGALALVDRASGEVVASLALEFELAEGAVDASGQRFLAVGLGGRPVRQILGAWDVDSGQALFTKRFPLHRTQGLSWDNDMLRVTTGTHDVRLERATGRAPSRPPEAPPHVEGATVLDREGTTKAPGVRVRLGTHDAVAFDRDRQLLLSHRTSAPLIAATWRTVAAGAPAALVMIDKDGVITLKDATAVQSAQLPDRLVALAADTRGAVYGVSRTGSVVELDAQGAVSVRARLPRRVSRAALDVTADGSTAVVVSGSQGYTVTLGDTGVVSDAFAVPPIARAVAISADGLHLATTDGVDVFTFSPERELRATIRFQATGRAVVTNADDTRVLPSGARSAVRLRRGDKPVRRSSDEDTTAWAEMTRSDIPL